MGEYRTVEEALPVAAKAVAIPEPERPYDRWWWSLAANSRSTRKGEMDGVCSIMLRPCRVLRDGTVDIAPESLTRHFNVGTLLDGDGNLTPLGEAIIAVIKLAAQ